MVTDFPRNVARAVFSLSATGQADEEFWWSNVLQSNVATYMASANQSLPGYSPFREVQVYVDGQLAGVQWPFPVVFTGGVSPSFWTPMVGTDAFDLKETEIDLSPWLGVLCDGRPHNFSMNVVGLDDDGGTGARLSAGVGSNWQLTGKVFVWLDAAGSVTTGAAPTVDGAAPTIAVSQALTRNATGFNDTLTYTTSVRRQLRVSGSITTSTGSRAVSWTQDLTHTDNGTLLDGGNSQLNNITTDGTDTSTGSGGGGGSFSSQYSFPLFSNISTTLLPNGTTRSAATIERNKTLARTGVTTAGGGGVAPSGLQLFAALPATAGLAGRLTATSWQAAQRGEAVLLLSTNDSTGFGGLSGRLRFGGGTGGAAGTMGDEADEELYVREVQVDSSGAVRSDVERLAGRDVVGSRPVATGGKVVVNDAAGAGSGQQGGAQMGVVDADAGVLVAVGRGRGGIL